MKLNKPARVLRMAGVNLIVVALVVFFAELVASKYIDIPSDLFLSSWRFNHTWKPGGKIVHREWISKNPEWPEPYIHRFNKQGWIEAYDIEKNKPADTVRIFYVGDSFTEGTAPMDQSVPSRVETRLNENDTALKFEVINTGTSSYSPLVEYVLIRYRILEYDPDLIVLNIDMTDDFDDWKYSKTVVYDTDGNPWAVPPRRITELPFVDTEHGLVKASWITDLHFFLFRHSYVYNLLLHHFKTTDGKNRVRFRKPIHPRQDRYAWCAETWDEKLREHASLTLATVRQIARLTRQHGVKLMVTAVPWYSQYDMDHSKGGYPLCLSPTPHYEIQKVAADESVPYLNSFEALRSQIINTPQNRYYYRDDMHFNPDGYAIWADKHYDFIVDPANRLLPDTFYDHQGNP